MTFPVVIFDLRRLSMKRLSVILLILSFTILSVVRNSEAGPTVIRDSRITDLAITPALGRGYTLVTNTFQSMCMLNVVTTEPVYDFQYSFESIETDNKTTSKVTTDTTANYSTMAITAMVRANSSVASDVQETSHSIKVELNMDTYYASVDEARTNLSKPAENLLKKKDLPGFFHACGSTYIRSLGRNAKFISIFTYTTKTTQRDTAFEAQLQLQIKGFGAGLLGGSGGVDNTTTGNFGSMSSERKLIINTRAWGLGKNEGASLISYDLETFKAAVKDAFISMQNPMTGRITTMEVVPWVEYTGFQDSIDLEETEGQVVGEKVPNYRKKDVLNQNAEFLGEIEKADRNRVNNYYTAKLCRETIKANYKQDDGVKFIEGYENAKLVNNRTGKADFTLGELDKLLTEQYVDDMLKNREAFMYGEKGAQKCMDKMFGSDMFRKKWGEYAECTGVRSGFVSILNNKVNDYCMPTIYPEPAATGNGTAGK